MDKVDVSDRAREAAAEWCASQPFPSKQAEAPMIAAGGYDHHTLVQAFARFERETLERAAVWQSIETFDEPTACGNSSGVLIAEADGTVGEAYHRNYGGEDDGWWWINTSWGDYPEPDRPTPSHWQPLPAPPRALEQQP